MIFIIGGHERCVDMAESHLAIGALKIPPGQKYRGTGDAVYHGVGYSSMTKTSV
jgi:hypothetical protein